MSVRFETFSCRLAALALVALVFLILLGALTGVARPKVVDTRDGKTGDGDLYARIVERVAAGESYYPVATEEQRVMGYPLYPTTTVREPALAEMLSWLPNVPARKGALIGLTLLALGLWGWRLQARWHTPLLTAWGLFSLYFSGLFGFYGQSYLFHECWAGLLLLISLAFYDAAGAAGRSAGIWLFLSLLCALAAVLIRELAAPFLLVMMFAALCERKWREAALWTLVILCFAAFMLWHSHMVSLFSLVGDRHSSGWATFLGWPGTLMMLHWHGVLLLTPVWLAILLVPLMLLGAAGWPGRTGTRLALLCFGYAAGFCLFGRRDTSYWGLVCIPLMGLALIAAPGSLVSLFRRIRRA